MAHDAPPKSCSASRAKAQSNKTSPKQSVDSTLSVDKFSESSDSNINTTGSLRSSSTASYLINRSINQSINQTESESDLHRLPAWLKQTRLWLLHHVNEGDSVVMRFQSMCGIELIESNVTQSVNAPKNESQIVDESIHRSTTQRYRVTQPVIHAYFTMAAAMGNELFYIVFLPLLHWLIDATLLRRVILMWLATYWVGQCVKDLMQLPRPASPMIAKLETHYETEYGFPSTHAMIALTMPAAALRLMHEQNQSTHQSTPWNLPLAVVAAFIWTLSISCSRLYNGVHSLVDIIGGLFFGSCILVPVVFLSQFFDAWLMHAPPHSIECLLLVSWTLVALYPRPKRWTNCYGDLTIIIGVATGVFISVLATSRTRQWQSLAATKDPMTLEFWPLALARVLIGTTVLFIVRAVFKAACLFFLPRLLLNDYDSTSKSQLRPDRIYLTEIPYRWITYSVIGFAAIDCMPRLFDLVGV